MLGAIAGDIIGSAYEFDPVKTKDFPLFTEASHFTDDTVHSIAIADALLNDRPFAETLQKWSRKYPDAGYGRKMNDWIFSEDPMPYNSWGNGSAMRVSSVGFLFGGKKNVLQKAKESAEITHNHPEGIKGAQATALSIYLGRSKTDKEWIRKLISRLFGYDMNRNIPEIRDSYKYDLSCQGSVPESIIAFLDADDFEDTIRNAISLGGDADTMACIAGGIAEAFYDEIPKNIRNRVYKILPEEMIAIIEKVKKKAP